MANFSGIKIPDAFIIWIGLLAGAVGLALHTWLIIDAASHTGVVFPKWVTQIDYNGFSEGPFELFFIPGLFLLSVYASYLYARTEVI